MDDERLKALIEEATVSCYDEEEAFWGIFCALQMNVSFPLRAAVGGEGTNLIGLDEPSSSPQGGVMARVEKSGQEETVALTALELVDADPVSAEWLAAYRYWLTD